MAKRERAPRLNKEQKRLLESLIPQGSPTWSLFKRFWEDKRKTRLTAAEHLRFKRLLNGKGIYSGEFYKLLDLLNEFFDRKNLHLFESEENSATATPSSRSKPPLDSEKRIQLWNEFKNQFTDQSENAWMHATSWRLGKFETELNWENGELQSHVGELFSMEKSPATQEVIKAIHAYRNLCVQGIKPTLSQIKELRVVFARIKYSSARGGFWETQKRLADWIRKHSKWKTADEWVGDTEASIQAHDYAVTINARACLYHCVIFLFPYFMVSPRRTFSGVLPYMKQTLLGLVLSKNNPELKNLCEQSGSSMETLDDDTKVFRGRTREEQKEIDDFVKEIVVRASNQKGELWSLGGYPQLSILEDIILRKGGSHTRQANAFIATAHDEKYRHSAFPNDKTVSNLLRNTKFRRSSIFVFDPAERKEVMDAIKKKRSDYEVLLVGHGQDVPVGVGFSLNLVPWLVKDGMWLKILREAHQLFDREKADFWEREFGWELLPAP